MSGNLQKVHPTGSGALLVEDDEADAETILESLKSLAVSEVRRVSSVGEAIAFLRGDGQSDVLRLPRLILLDLKCGSPSGLQFLEWVKNQELLRRIPVVGYCTPFSQEAINLAYDLRVNSAIEKPVRSEGFARMMKGLVGFWMESNQPPTFESAPSGKSIVEA